MSVIVDQVSERYDGHSAADLARSVGGSARNFRFNISGERMMGESSLRVHHNFSSCRDFIGSSVEINGKLLDNG